MTDSELRELDRLLAEKVMGWHLWPVEPVEGNCQWWHNESGRPMYSTVNWHPTTSIEQAMTVAERATDAGWLIELRLWPETEIGKKVEAMLTYLNFSRSIVTAQAEGLAMDKATALAICQAAAEAVEGEP